MDLDTREGGGGVDGAGEDAFAERAERDEPDAEFCARGEDALFGAAPPQVVLAFDGGHRLHGVGAAVAILRAEAGRDLYDKDLQDLIGKLSTLSDAFRAK
jgi:hypothetical protein